MRSWVQAIIIVAALLVIAGWFWLDNSVTIRAIHAPAGIYRVPFETHGGTVYVSQFEKSMMIAGWIATAVLVGVQLILNLKRQAK